MDHNNHGSSPSGGNQQSHLSHSPSPQLNNYQSNIDPTALGLGIQTLPSNDTSIHQQYQNGNYNQPQDLPPYDAKNGYLEQNQQFTQSSLGEPLFAPSQDYSLQPDFNQQFKPENQTFGQPDQNFTEAYMSTNSFQEDFPLYSAPGNNDQFDPNFSLYEPSQQQPLNQSINPAELSMNDMSSPQHHTPTPPHMLQQPGSAQHSPSFNQHQFQRSPAHSRHVSLGPESAQYPNAQLPTDWSMMPPQFMTHRRSPSEYSDVSASSAAPSPNLVQHDSFDNGDPRHSPLVHAQDPRMYDVLNIQNFSISDNQHGASPHRGMSPAHTPSHSPRLGPQQMPMNQQQSPFMLSMMPQSNQFIPTSGPEMYQQNQDQFINRPGSNEIGAAQQMVTPEINVELVSVSRTNSFEPPKPALDQDALTPPDRGEFVK
jgi:hypothetical protein